MKRLIKSFGIFAIVMIVTVAFNTVEVKADIDPETGLGWDDSTIYINSTMTEDEWRAALEADQAEFAKQNEAEEAAIASSKSSSSSKSDSTSSTKSTSESSYTDEEIEAAWEETEKTPSTCIAEGSVTYKNSLTGETKTETIPITDIHAYELEERVDPTCTEPGYDIYTCSLCGESYKKEFDAKGHKRGEPVITKAPEFFREGESETYCSVCGELIETTTIPQTCPFPFAITIAFGAGAIVFVLGVLSLLIKRR